MPYLSATVRAWGAVGLPLVVDKTRPVHSLEGASWPFTSECSLKLQIVFLYTSPSVIIFAVLLFFLILCLSSSIFTAMSYLHELHSRAFFRQYWSSPQCVRSLVTTSLHLRHYPPADLLPCSGHNKEFLRDTFILRMLNVSNKAKSLSHEHR